MNPHRITLSTGASVKMDGDVDSLIETLYDEIMVKNSFRAEFSDIASEVSFVVSQMTRAERDRYLFICLGVLIDRFHREMYRDWEQKGTE
ncbi:MAG: hypothetical protein HYU36_18685 [Planctomycetes bacterium]|nr:hypothetical protein [Planctomycetota bacterium]